MSCSELLAVAARCQAALRQGQADGPVLQEQSLPLQLLPLLLR
jgi:hypothetical protein